MYYSINVFIPRRDCESITKRWSNCFYFPFYCVLETVLTLSKPALSIGLILKMFYSPKGAIHKLRNPFHGLMFYTSHFFLVNRVAHQKLNQTTAELSFG